jgi:hypothetical protein
VQYTNFFIRNSNSVDIDFIIDQGVCHAHLSCNEEATIVSYDAHVHEHVISSLRSQNFVVSIWIINLQTQLKTILLIVALHENGLVTVNRLLIFFAHFVSKVDKVNC